MSKTPEESEYRNLNSRESSVFGRFERFLSNLFDLIDLLGKRIFGELWNLVFESVQDALSFGVLSFLPNWIILKLTGQDFSDWKSCFIISYSDADRYFCFVVVAALFAGVVTFGLRLLQRFLKSVNFPSTIKFMSKAWRVLRKWKI